jgi:hypothetical protein
MEDTMQRNQIIIGSTVLAAILLVGGCATSSDSGSVYSSGQTRREQTVRLGVVESRRSTSGTQARSVPSPAAPSAALPVPTSAAGADRPLAPSSVQ